MLSRTMEDSQLGAKIRACIDQLLMEQDLEEEYGEDTPLFTSGLLDSMAMIRLVSMLETSLGMAMSPAEITVEAFDTPGGIRQAVLKSR